MAFDRSRNAPSVPRESEIGQTHDGVEASRTIVPREPEVLAMGLPRPVLIVQADAQRNTARQLPSTVDVMPRVCTHSPSDAARDLARVLRGLPNVRIDADAIPIDADYLEDN